MAKGNVFTPLLIELSSRKSANRVPEPELVMDDPGQVDAFDAMGKADGSLAPLYLLQTIHASQIVQPGDRVLDLGCGSANQLAMIAGLNPETQFIGVELSEVMLDKARGTILEFGLQNVEFLHGDMTALEDCGVGTVDAIFSALALHHLPTVSHLESTFSEIDKVLKPGGGLYLVDLGHLKTERAIRLFADQYAETQPAVFIEDYLNSLRAAFELKDWKRLHRQHLAHRGALLKSTFLVPYMIAVKSAVRRELPASLQSELRSIYLAMSDDQQRDYKNLASFFQLGGLKTPRVH